MLTAPGNSAAEAQHCNPELGRTIGEEEREEERGVEREEERGKEREEERERAGAMAKVLRAKQRRAGGKNNASIGERERRKAAGLLCLM